MLRYAKGPSPRVLAGWQATPNADWESLSAEDKDRVREALLRDQGGLCAYCQRRIPAQDEPMKVEHWLPQSEGADELRWNNLLAVCLGNEGAPASEQHCDTARGNAPLFLSPTEGGGPSPIDHLQYTSTGQVRAKDTPQRAVVQRDIVALNLDASRLRRARAAIYDELKRILDRGGWTPKTLRDEYRRAQLVPGTASLPLGEVVRHHLRRWARQKNIEL